VRQKVKVLLVDDSPMFRQTLSLILQADAAIEIIAIADDYLAAARKIKLHAPDVVIMDVQLPGRQGLAHLREVLNRYPVPVLVVSGAAGRDGQVAQKAYEIGAYEVLSKELFTADTISEETRKRLCYLVRTASISKVSSISSKASNFVVPQKLSADVILPLKKRTNLLRCSTRVVAIGASTGGTEAIRAILEALPLSSPGIVIVQHMPENFTRSFAERLNNLCEIEVKEAADGDLILPGRALVAPGNAHLIVQKSGLQYFVRLLGGPHVNRHRPSVDVLFRSLALCVGENGIGVLLTGMGDDGARGLLEIREAGGFTIAQDQASCVVFGMPREAIALNAVERVLPLNDIANSVIRVSSEVR
jgi:two-component system, chemotaxis family, protein-glutamate methylesterase/glutaminase